MILQQTNSGPVWVFSEQECSDYAYICACLPTDRLSQRDQKFIIQMEVKFRKGGGYLTQGQWDWFAGIAANNADFVLNADEAARSIRSFAASLSNPK